MATHAERRVRPHHHLEKVRVGVHLGLLFARDDDVGVGVERLQVGVDFGGVKSTPMPLGSRSARALGRDVCAQLDGARDLGNLRALASHRELVELELDVALHVVLRLEADFAVGRERALEVARLEIADAHGVAPEAQGRTHVGQLLAEGGDGHRALAEIERAVHVDGVVAGLVGEARLAIDDAARANVAGQCDQQATEVEVSCAQLGLDGLEVFRALVRGTKQRAGQGAEGIETAALALVDMQLEREPLAPRRQSPRHQRAPRPMVRAVRSRGGRSFLRL